MDEDLEAGAGGQPGGAYAGDPPDERTLAILKRYAAGEIAARQTAWELGPDATEHDVYVLTLNAGLTVPSPPPETVKREVEALQRLYSLR